MPKFNVRVYRRAIDLVTVVAPDERHAAGQASQILRGRPLDAPSSNGVYQMGHVESYAIVDDNGVVLKELP